MLRLNFGRLKKGEGLCEGEGLKDLDNLNRRHVFKHLLLRNLEKFMIHFLPLR